MDKLSFDDLTTAAFIYYIVSHSEEGWADKAYKKFYNECYNELSEYLENENKKAIEKIVNCITEFLKSWHSLRGADETKFRDQLENFLSKDENIIKIRKFSKKEIEKSSLEDIIESGELYQSIMGIEGVGPTNSSKILHMLCPKFFIMWDKRIREKYIGKKSNADAYVKFLRLMIDKIPASLDSIQMKDIEEILEDKSCEKTIAKLIDEYNFVTITKGIDLNKIKSIIKKLSMLNKNFIKI